MPNHLANYYAFPFAITCVWPVFMTFLEEWMTGRQKTYRTSDVLLMVSAPVLSIVLFNGANHVDSAPWKNLSFDYTQQVGRTLSVIDSVCVNKPAMGNTLMDESVAALMPHCLAEKEWGYLNRYTEDVKVSAETVIFYDSDRAINGSSVGAFLEIAQKAHINTFYQLPDTRIVIGSKRMQEFARLHPELSPWQRP